ncbi:hypothetical protein G9A89_023086 [Geosiphon pyriformis]|nr:hypothetical protein G9A89_023086 [Geosiphon pyriformis]
MGLLNLEEQLAFYVCVPLLLWSALVWASNYCKLPSYGELDSWWSMTPFEPNLALYVVILYISYYVLLEPVAGFLYSPILLYMAHNATKFAATHPNHNALAGYVHIASWIAQFIGHGFVEKKAPALMDNLAQALLLAPLFVWLELLFLLGYRSALRQRVGAKVELAIAELKKQEAKEVE